ncbi:phage tail tape measure protein [Streptococcus mitis]|uniref:phage tail tape measure protein n=1 Tax=Streptococcus mitis TaxID=28037 RepID=UPI001159D12A|nr:phage tail tape measure protein [Streptococcus mitis]
MASNIGELVATATLDVAPFQSNVGRLKTYLKGVDNSLKAMENNFKGAGNNVSNLKGLLSQTGSALNSYQKVLSSQSERYNQLKASIGDVSTATAEQKQKLVEASASMTATAAKVAELQNRYEQLAGSMRRAYIDDSAFTKFGKSAQEVGNKISQVGQTVSGFGSALTRGVTAPIVAGAGLVVKAAIDYESAFAGVKKTVDETATVSYKNLSDGIRQMAKELPASAVEIANVAEVAGQLGIKAEDILSFSRTMIDMGESTNLSAEEAATAIAKVANIMGLTSNDYSRFGASVVDLGNNFATTEKDIVEMTNRLAAGGKLAGLSTPDILGLATAMSSVGIEAEAGGTAMVQTLTGIGKAVSGVGKGAKEKLELIAQIAGTTSESFSQAWKEKPAEALQSFIKGLQKAHEEGKNMDGILSDLGMKGIRQGNMLKSLALASDKMSAAVNRSNQAWKENTALTNEANKRYETTESQLKMFRNQLTDIAIEFGGPLIKALREGLNAAKPWIENLSELAKKFSSLSTEQQQNILKWGLFAAALGPALKLLGGGISVIGGFVKAIGGLSKGIGFLSGSAKYLANLPAGLTALSSSAGAAETAMAGVSTSAGSLSGAFGALANPLGLIVGSIALATAGLVYLGNEKDKARIKTEEFGSQLSDTARGELRSFQKTVDETATAVANFGTHAGDVEKVSGAFKKLYDEVAESAEKSNKRMEELGAKWGLSEEDIARAREKNGQVVSNTEAMMNQINEIYQRHNGDASKFSQEEKEIILNNQNEMIKAKLSMMSLSAEQQKAALQALNGEVASLNETQLKHTKDVLKQALDEEKNLYETSKSELKELLDGKAIDQETYNKKMQQLEANHTQTMEALGTKYYQVMKTLDEKVKARTGQNWNYWEEAKKALEEYGLSYEAIGQKAAEASEKAGNSHSILAKYTSDMSKEVKEANDAWSLLVGNIDKNGNFEIKSNVKEVIGEAAKSAEGWEQLQFIAKTADINSNARVTIAEALVESGKWSTMTLEEKQLIVQNQAGLQAIFDSEKNLKIWNDMPANVKELLLKNTDIMSKADEATKALTNYDALAPKQKELLANDENFRNAVSRSTDTLTTWNATTPITKDLKVNPNNVLYGSQLSIDKLIEWNLAPAQTKSLDAVDNTAGAVASASLSVNSPKQETPIGINATDLTGPESASASAGINAIKQNFPIDINATNKTQGEANSASQSVNAVKQNNPISIKAQNNTQSAISSVLGGLASLPAVKFIDIITRTFTQKHAKGTNNHPGGLATVNDQRGSLYKEMVTLPDGTSFIPHGRNVTLPLPPGTKVMRAGKTRSLMNRLGIPNYENGIGFEDTKISHLTRRIQSINTKGSNRGYQNTSYTIGGYSGGDNQAVVSELVSLKESLENLLGRLLDKDTNTYLDGRVIAESSYQYQGNIMRREGI